MYFWDLMFMYPVESAVIISIISVIYIGWIKKFWYLHKPSLYLTRMGEWRVRRFVGRIVGFETEHGEKLLSNEWKSIKKDDSVIIRIYIGGQPIRCMKLDVADIWTVRRVPRKLFKREITMNKKNVFWNPAQNYYELTDENVPIYIIKPHIFEKVILRKVDNLDVKATRGSKVSPQLIHSGYFGNHLALPPDEYEENDDVVGDISEYAYSVVDRGSYGEYNSVMADEGKENKEVDGDV